MFVHIILNIVKIVTLPLLLTGCLSDTLGPKMNIGASKTSNTTPSSASISANVSSYSFGFVPVGTYSEEFRIKITNSGTKDASGCVSPSLSGTNHSEFLISNNTCGTSIKANNYCYITIKANPKTDECVVPSGARAGILNFSCSSTGQSIAIPLTMSAQDICLFTINNGATYANTSPVNLSYSTEGTNISLCFSESSSQSTCPISSTPETITSFGLEDIVADSIPATMKTVYAWVRYSYNQKIFNGRVVSNSIIFDNELPTITNYSCATPAVCPTITNTPEIAVKITASEDLDLTYLNTGYHLQVSTVGMSYAVSKFTPVSGSNYTYMAKVYITPTAGVSDTDVSIYFATPTSVYDLAGNSLKYTPTPITYRFDVKEPTPVFSSIPMYADLPTPVSADPHNSHGFKVYLNFNEGVTGLTSNNIIAPTGTVTITSVNPAAVAGVYPTSYVIDGYIDPTGIADYSTFEVKFVPTVAPVTDRAGNIVNSSLAKTLTAVFLRPTVSLSYTPDNNVPSTHGSSHISANSFYIYASFTRGTTDPTPDPIGTSQFTSNYLAKILVTPGDALTFNSITPVATGVYGISCSIDTNPNGTPITIVMPTGFASDVGGNYSYSQSLTFNHIGDPSIALTTSSNYHLFPITAGSNPETSNNLNSEISIDLAAVSHSSLDSFECLYENTSVNSTDVSADSCSELDSLIKIDSTGAGAFVIGKAYFSSVDLTAKTATWKWRPTINQRGTYKLNFRVKDSFGHPVTTPTPVASPYYITVRDNISTSSLAAYVDSYFTLATPHDTKDIAVDGSLNPAITILKDLVRDQNLTCSGYDGGGTNASYIDTTAGINFGSMISNTANSFSAGAWIKAPTVVAATRCILANLDIGSTSNGWYLGVDSNNKLTVNIQVDDTQYITYTDNTALTADSWYFVFFTWENSTPSLKLYKNGLEVTNKTSLTLGSVGGATFVGDVYLAQCPSGNTLSNTSGVNSSFVYTSTLSANLINSNFLATANRFRTFKPKTPPVWSSSNVAYYFDAFFAQDGVIPHPTSDVGVCGNGNIHNMTFSDVSSDHEPAPDNCDINSWHGAGASGTPPQTPAPYFYHLDGVDDKIILSDLHPTPGFEGGMSISTWVRPTMAAGVGAAAVIYMRGDVSYDGVNLKIDENNQFAFRISTDTAGAEAIAACAPTVEAHKWYNITATKSLSALKIYMNGDYCGNADLLPEATIAFGTPTAIDYIGANTSGTPEFFNGDISSLILYTTPISSQQVKQNFYADADRFRIVNLEKTTTQGLVLHLDAANAKNKLEPAPAAQDYFSDLSPLNYKEAATTNRVDPYISLGAGSGFAGNGTVITNFYRLNMSNQSDYVAMTPNTTLDSSTEGTYVIWYYAQPTPTCTLISRSGINAAGTTINSGLSIKIDANNKLNVIITDYAGAGPGPTPVYTTIAQVAVTADNWQHVAFIYNQSATSGNKNKLYYNGQEVTSDVYYTSANWDFAGDPGNDVDTYSIGDNGADGGGGCTGAIGIFKAFNRALLQSEVLQMCKAEKWRFNTNICQ
ncbi:MAG: laminin G domain-containing protein [Oligoflexia bacterium]|nr:laminin G domain-containing protein [Oligoflexia bacterium]